MKEIILQQFNLLARLIKSKISQQAELIDAKIHLAVGGISARVDKFAAELDTIRAENRNLRDLVGASSLHTALQHPSSSPGLPGSLGREVLATGLNCTLSSAAQSTYQETRRTVRLLPVALLPSESFPDAARRFLIEKMKMPQDTANLIAFDNVDLITAKHGLEAWNPLCKPLWSELLLETC